MTNNPSDCELKLSSSDKGNQKNEERVGIKGSNLIQHQEEEEKRRQYR